MGVTQAVPYGEALTGSASPAIDRVGRIETHGIDFIADGERHGHPRELTRLEESNRKVLEATAEVLRLLDSQPTEKTPSPLLRGLASLTAAMREHQAREVDVVYEIFWRDPVGGD